MKIEIYRALEDALTQAEGALTTVMYYANDEDEKSEKWKMEFLKTLNKLQCLKEEMIFTLHIDETED